MRGRALTDEDKDAILKAVGDAWKAQPAQRLGQLLANWLRDCWPDHLPSRPLGTLSFIEDGDLARNLGLWAQPDVRPNLAARLGECSFCSGGMADYFTCPPEEAL